MTLGTVLERAARAPVDRLAAEALLRPLGIADERWQHTPLGTAMTGGGLELSSRDLLALGQLCLDGGAHGGRRLVPEAWVAASIAPHARVDENAEYGYLLWLRSFPVKGSPTAGFLMSGTGGQRVAAFPALGLVAVVTTVDYRGGMAAHQRTDRLLRDFVLAAVE